MVDSRDREICPPGLSARHLLEALNSHEKFKKQPVKCKCLHFPLI